MVLYNSKSSSHKQIQQSQTIPFLTLLWHTIFLFLLFPFANSISFNFSGFDPNNQVMIQYQHDAHPSNGEIQLTKDQVNTFLNGSAGQAFYSQPIHLWDNETGNLTNFNTHFSFIIKSINPGYVGDGLTFFLSAPNATLPSPTNAMLPSFGSGGYLGLFENTTALNDTNKQIVAVEFDTYQNSWDPSTYHVGIDVNMINSTTSLVLNTSLVSQTTNAWVSYDSTNKTLSVYLTYEENRLSKKKPYEENPIFQGVYLSTVVDLSKVLPEWVHVGFSASTGLSTETHGIISWTFNSTLGGLPSNSPSGGSLPTSKGRKMNLPLIVGLVLSIGALSCGVGLFWFMKRKKIILDENNEMALDGSIDDIIDFEKGKGPRRFSFRELIHSTNNFSGEGKLGQGGFGGVYKGVLIDTKGEIAVKRISRGSKQGIKEYVSEVKIISRLRHRNLVPLIGWCHERGDLLLVYEFMPNGSLDTHLFGKKSKLSWTIRYKIANGLASALLYLHEEWEQCVIHRDIKSSNIMLDSNFNTKLGDFGLARLVDHELGLETSVVAGTMGYLAPECVFIGKASKESDVYSFGVVALEIACGRKQMELNRTSGHVTLSEWVWSLYGKGQLFEAVDKDLAMDYDESQAKRLMLVGLWCCHPDPNLRPSIRQAINILSSEAPLPVLPSQMPKPVYSSPPISLPSYSLPV